CGSRRNQVLYPSRVNRMSKRVNIAKNWCYFLPLKRMGSSHESKRGNDDFAAEPSSADHYFKRDSAVTHCDEMLDAEKTGGCLFKLLHARTIVRKPAALDDILNPPHETFLIADIWAADVKPFGKRRGSAA